MINHGNSKSLKPKQIEIEISFEKKLSSLSYLAEKDFWNIQDKNICKEIKAANFGFLYTLSETKYIYYCFALCLGAVINVGKIIKVGVF